MIGSAVSGWPVRGNPAAGETAEWHYNYPIATKAEKTHYIYGHPDPLFERGD